MAWKIVIDFAADSPSVHQLRNFGEDLWRFCKDDGWASISLADIDRATNQMTINVSSSRRVRRTVSATNRLLREHFLEAYAHISVRNIGPERP